MGTIVAKRDGRLAGARIAILMESDYVEPELHYYQRRFAEEGAQAVFLTRLWGQPSMTFHGHEFQQPFTVDGDLESVDEEMLRSFDALIVPSGMVSDRLRYTDNVNELPPATRLLQKAFETPELLKGIICHGMWLVAPIPEVVAGRRITCHNNLLGDVKNMGAVYTDQDVVVDRDLVTGRSADHCHLFARMIIDLVAAKRGLGAEPSGTLPLPRTQTGNPAAPVTTRSPEPAPVASKATTAPGATNASATTPSSLYRPDFTFSDLVAGYVEEYDAETGHLVLRTSDGRTAPARLDGDFSAEFLRNLGSPYLDASSHVQELLRPGRFLYAYGVFYPENDGYVMEVKRLVLLGRGEGEYEFEKAGWWIQQLRELASFYRRAQFGADDIDYQDYRTNLRLGGDKKSDQYTQETDTISRMIYGMASAYMLTGNEEFLEVAEKGTEYLREHMRFVDRDEDIVYWYHGIDVRDGVEHKLFTSEFGDDYHAIPMYEQIYALAGPTQLYRITGDPRINADTEATMRLFERHYRDNEQGGYFSHIDPITLSAEHESLGPNQARKNWNSVGDHAPAYLINLWLATGEERYATMLEDTFDTIAEHFPDPESPFVNERFHRDWAKDQTYAWQQNRAVVGHNLKIAWNLMRMMSIKGKAGYQELAEHLASIMPDLGSDQQRGGWYDVVERAVSPGEQRHRFVWHDRKAWWQQEQAILAYLILAGETGNEEFAKQAREPRPSTTPSSWTTTRARSTSTCWPTGCRTCWAPSAQGQPLDEHVPLGRTVLPGHRLPAPAAERPAADPVVQAASGRVRRPGAAGLAGRAAGRCGPAGLGRGGRQAVVGLRPEALTVKLPDVEEAVTVRVHLSPTEPAE